LFVGALATLAHAAPLTSDSIAGFWLTDDKDGVIELYPCGAQICGRFHWLKDDSPEKPSLDDHNHDPTLRQRPLCGLPFMGAFQPEEGGKFDNGWIYSVRDGNTYSASLSLLNADSLELRGYFLIPLLGESRTWTRTGAEPVCSRDR
jgi:uncharacterized protein (DUF2147 family)